MLETKDMAVAVAAATMARRRGEGRRRRRVEACRLLLSACSNQ